MMQPVPIESFLALLTPVCSGLVCIVLVLLYSPVWDRLKGTGMRTSLVSYYSLVVLNWSMLIALTLFPREFTYIRPLSGYTTLLVPVVLYQFIFILTRTDSRERFSMLHYVLPTIIFLVHFIWSWSVPSEVMLETSFYNTQSIPGYKGFYALAALILPVRLLFGLVYSILGILHYHRYRRMIVNYSSDLQHSSLYWLRIFLILWISFIIGPVVLTVIPFKMLLTQFQFFFLAILLFAQHIMLCFNAIRGNYVLVEGSEEPRANKFGLPRQEKQLHRDGFIQFLKERKPFIDPRLTISDLADKLKTNRSYLSTFINSTFGMNFSQFINECRLQELDRILADSGSADKSNMEKITMAGFGSYQSYRRALKMQEERKVLPADR